MKNIENFIESLVKIEYIENSKCYGHYPFQLFAEMADGKTEINSLLLGGDVVSCYRRFAHYINSGAKRIYLSLDFPKCGDIHNDFVAILTFENGNVDILAIPYNMENGELFEIIKKSTHLDSIKSQLDSFL